jgi:hypothetical protein
MYSELCETLDVNERSELISTVLSGRQPGDHAQ